MRSMSSAGRDGTFSEVPTSASTSGRPPTSPQRSTTPPSSIAEEVVDAELREKLKLVFGAKTGLHANMAILPSLDEIELPDDKVRLVILERPSHDLPAPFVDWWTNHCERPNQILVLTVDNNAVGTLRATARQMKAISIVEKAVLQRTGKDSTQFREVETIAARSANQFTSAVRESFKTVVFPVAKGHRAADLKMEFKENNYDGEQQIVTVLAERGKFIPSAEIDGKIDTLRSYAEDDLFDADAVPHIELKRKAGARTSWYWLPAGGLEHLVKTCVSRKLWRARRAGLQEVRPHHLRQRTPGNCRRCPCARDVHPERYLGGRGRHLRFGHRRPGPGPLRKDVWTAVLRPVQTRSGFWRWIRPAKLQTGPAFHWQAPIDIRPVLTSASAGVKLLVSVMPRSTKVLATFDGTPPKEGREVGAETQVPAGTEMIRLVGKVGDRYGQELSVTVQRPKTTGGDQPKSKPGLQDNQPVFVNYMIKSKSTPQAYEMIEAMKAASGAVIKGGRIEVTGTSEQDFLAATFGDSIALDSNTIETLVKTLARKAGTSDPRSRCRSTPCGSAPGGISRISPTSSPSTSTKSTGPRARRIGPTVLCTEIPMSGFDCEDHYVEHCYSADPENHERYCDDLRSFRRTCSTHGGGARARGRAAGGDRKVEVGHDLRRTPSRIQSASQGRAQEVGAVVRGQ